MFHGQQAQQALHTNRSQHSESTRTRGSDFYYTTVGVWHATLLLHLHPTFNHCNVALVTIEPAHQTLGPRSWVWRLAVALVTFEVRLCRVPCLLTDVWLCVFFADTAEQLLYVFCSHALPCTLPWQPCHLMLEIGLYRFNTASDNKSIIGPNSKTIITRVSPECWLAQCSLYWGLSTEFSLQGVMYRLISTGFNYSVLCTGYVYRVIFTGFYLQGYL
jgi:hypothetical protein